MGTTGAATNFRIHFRIWDEQSGGNLIWAEKQIVTVNGLGLFSVQLGEGDILTEANKAPDGQLAVLAENAGLLEAFDGSDRYIGVTVIQTEQTPGEVQPRLRFLASPFAIVADRATYAESGPTGQAFTASAVTSTGDVTGANLTTAGAVNSASVTATGNVTGANLSTDGAVSSGSVTSTGQVRGGTLHSDGAVTGSNVDVTGQVKGVSLYITGASDVGSVSASGSIVSTELIVSQKGMTALQDITAFGNIQSQNDITAFGNFVNSGATGTGHRTRLGCPRNGSSESYPLSLYDTTGGREWDFNILSNGNLGLAYNNSGRVQLNSGTGGWVTWSDFRLKEDINPLEDLLEKAIRMKPSSYNYISDTSKQVVIGFIAQDVQEIFPDLVHEDSKGMLSLTYNDFGVIAIGAIKELNQEVEAKEKRISDLESRLIKMEKKLELMISQ